MKKPIFFLVALFVYCSDPTSSKDNKTVQDIDGNVYQTVTIGSQVWMAENLKVTHYRNGDVIPFVSDADAWGGLSTAACHIYNGDTTGSAAYGLLYNFFAAVDSNNIAPLGWHVPTDEEWQLLVNYLGGDSLAGGKMKSRGTLEGFDGLWREPNEGASNESGFSVIPGGYRAGDGSYEGMAVSARFWSSTLRDNIRGWHLRLAYDNPMAERRFGGMNGGYSIRCVRD